MQLLIKPDPDLRPRRRVTLLISVGIHLFLLLFLVLNPEIFQTTPKRVIRIAGQDYDLSNTEFRELILPPPPPSQPPAPPPAIAEDRPLVQPPVPELPPPPPPVPAPQPPPTPEPPPVVIGPDDVVAEGARPDAPAPPPSGPASGDSERALAGSGEDEIDESLAAEPQTRSGPDQIAGNMNPNALRLPSLLDRAGQIVEESIRDSARRIGQGSGSGGIPSGPVDPNFSTEDPTILSDTRGYDFGPYLNQVVNRVRINWYSLIPEVARLGRQGIVVIIFTIAENGTIQDLRLVRNSGLDPLDRAAMGAITASNPFSRLPANFEGDHIVLQFTFLYNIRR